MRTVVVSQEETRELKNAVGMRNTAHLGGLELDVDSNALEPD